MSIVLKSRATLSILANRAKPNTIEMTDKVKEHMENTSLRSLFLVVIFVYGTLLSMANGDTIMELLFMCDSVEALWGTISNCKTSPLDLAYLRQTRPQISTSFHIPSRKTFPQEHFCSAHYLITYVHALRS